MRALAVFLLYLLTGLGAVAASVAPVPVAYDIDVELDPRQRTLTVSSEIALPAPVRALTLQLHAGLNPRFSTPDSELRVERLGADGYRERYRITLSDAGATRLRIDYAGSIHHVLSSSRREQSRGFRSSPGLIDQQGVFLSASSLWYPQLLGYPYLTFDMRVALPAGWSSVSQGARMQRNAGTQLTRERWAANTPQEEIYLIAAQFTEYARDVAGADPAVEAQVFLREPDQKLADRYLDATAGYVQMYEKLLGPYPYGKFALVENFWETGFGMPSFTLLGSRVIRLPFIVNSSYPHEILHNWWGNGVYVDFASGNWSEGLTAYLADHLIKEQQGQGVNYRQQSLQKYRDYAANSRDFPLSEFTGRHNSATEAVGYGKTLMLFHMLRRDLGDEVFVRALQAFYRDYRFRIAAFDDLRQVFERVAGVPLQTFFEQWVTRTGAPQLVLESTRVDKAEGGYRLQFELQQTQPGEAYLLNVPVAVSLQGQAKAHEFVVRMSGRQQRVELELTAPPTRVDVDPKFDVFRQLAIEETPPAFTQVFGAKALLVVLPDKAGDGQRAAWQAFANDVSHMGPDRVDIVGDGQIESLPDDRAVMVLGWVNRFAPQLQRELQRHPVSFDDTGVRMPGHEPTPRSEHAFAWVTRPQGAGGERHPRALITADRPDALPGLGRKIPHYHKYSYLAFSGDEPQNTVKGRWPVTDSPMSSLLQPGAERARLEPDSALIDPVSPFSAARMMRTVAALSDLQLQGRGLGSAGLEQAAGYIAQAFRQAGLQPGGDDGSYFQHFTARDEQGREHTLKNVVGVIQGRHPERKSQSLVFGAHYDHLGLGWPDVREQNRGKVHHGADDNASGIAVMLELARTLGRTFQPDRSVVFVAFGAEEAGRLGSKHFVAQQQTYPASATIGMLNLDSVGRLFDDSLMVLGSESASEWPHIFRGIGFVTGIPTAMVAEPLDASDQISFHEVGVPAVQLFTGAHADYHRPGDTADKIDADGLVKVAEVSRQVIDYLAGREQPMTAKLAVRETPTAGVASRKVSLGSIPDFTYQGSGYRLDGVVPGSPAEQAGLARSDVIVAIDDVAIQGIRDISKVLKSLQPGQMIRIRYLRAGEQREAQAELQAK